MTVRCADCDRVLAVYYGVSRDRDIRVRLATAANDLLEVHKRSAPRCAATAVRTQDRADPR